MTQINPYIGFAGKCKEAMTFYKDCIGGELELQTVGGSPMEEHCPAAMKDSILHSSLVKDKLVLFGTDMTGSGGITKGNNVSLCLSCSSEEEINVFYNKLSEGGEIFDPLKMQFFGAMMGMFKDKFGIPWMVYFDKNQNK
ncbi:VOC family protein [soil metagenome]